MLRLVLKARDAGHAAGVAFGVTKPSPWLLRLHDLLLAD
jgi:hypothetical protein